MKSKLDGILKLLKRNEEEFLYIEMKETVDKFGANSGTIAASKSTKKGSIQYPSAFELISMKAEESLKKYKTLVEIATPEKLNLGAHVRIHGVEYELVSETKNGVYYTYMGGKT